MANSSNSLNDAATSISVTARAACTMIAPDGLAYLGCTVANALKKYPSRAMAKGMRAPLIDVPFNVTTIDRAMAPVMMAALAGPSTIRVITETADFDAAKSCAGITYNTAAF